MAVKTNRIGDAMLKLMANDGCWSICVMDGHMNEVTFMVDAPIKLWKNMNPHPLNRARVAASYLARDERFEIGLFRCMDSAGRERRLRLFTAKPEYRGDYGDGAES